MNSVASTVSTASVTYGKQYILSCEMETEMETEMASVQISRSRFVVKLGLAKGKSRSTEKTETKDGAGDLI